MDILYLIHIHKPYIYYFLISCSPSFNWTEDQAGDKRRTHILFLCHVILHLTAVRVSLSPSRLSPADTSKSSLCSTRLRPKNIKITWQIKIHSLLPPDWAKLTPVNHESALLLLILLKTFRTATFLSQNWSCMKISRT